MKKKLGIMLLIYIDIIIFCTNYSYCYLDPSAMTYIIQVIAAIFIAVSTSIGIIFYKIKRKFLRKKKDKINIQKNLDDVENSKKDDSNEG